MAQMLQGNIPFSASTAEIIFNDKVVGQLQNLRWDERQNLKRINEIGSSTPVAILKGVSEYNISASKAFIDADMIATLLRGIDVQEFLQAQGTLPTITTKARITGNEGDASAVVSQILQSSSGSQIRQGAKLINFFFDIVVKSYSATTGNINADGTIDATNLEKLPVVTFKECSIESRNARIDVGNLVVMQDVSILSIGLMYGDSSVITGNL